MSLPDGLRAALGQVIADQRREWRRELEVIEAQARATIAELRAANESLRDDLTRRVDAAVAERLATLRDGADGSDGRDGADGKDGADGRDGLNGADGRDGKDGDPGPAGRDGADGKDADPEAVRAMVAEEVARAVAALPAPQDGRDGRDGRDGAPGKLPAVRAWQAGVWYAGDVVSHATGSWQAQRDTASEPPHEDWVCIAPAGRDGQDGRSFTVRGTWTEAEEYRALDVAVRDGSAFVARQDNPGPCPGEGWQLIALRGKPGKPGDKGERGMGLRGAPGPGVASLDVDAEGVVTLANGDGSTVQLDLYPLLASLRR